MNEPREQRGERRSDAVRRVQAGIIGLVLVALLVGLSTLLTSESRQADESVKASTAPATGTLVADPADAADDAMTDLGVEPAAVEPVLPTQAPPKLDEAAPVGPRVPDLQPDPQLDGTRQR